MTSQIIKSVTKGNIRKILMKNTKRTMDAMHTQSLQPLTPSAVNE